MVMEEITESRHYNSLEYNVQTICFVENSVKIFFGYNAVQILATFSLTQAQKAIVRKVITNYKEKNNLEEIMVVSYTLEESKVI